MNIVYGSEGHAREFDIWYFLRTSFHAYQINTEKASSMGIGTYLYVSDNGQ